MIAHIPFSLTENLDRRDVGELLSAAESEGITPEDVIVKAIKSFLGTRSDRQLALPLSAVSSLNGKGGADR